MLRDDDTSRASRLIRESAQVSAANEEKRYSHVLLEETGGDEE